MSEHLIRGLKKIFGIRKTRRISFSTVNPMAEAGGDFDSRYSQRGVCNG
ncbi:MAG: hypothetical protein R2831_05110 [Chitinophagaceae bacterium]